MLAALGYSGRFLMYVYQVKKYVIAKRFFVGHLNLHVFINLKIISVGYLIYPYSD